MTWLIPGESLDITLPHVPAPVAQFFASTDAIRCVKVGNDQEPLLDVAGQIAWRPIYYELGLCQSPGIFLRQSVIRALLSAQEKLPRDFELVVLDGWRSLSLQRQLAHYYGQSDGKYVATVDDVLVAPHTTGGAVDLTLSWRGQALGLGTDFDEFSVVSHLPFFEKVGGDSVLAKGYRHLRRLLSSVLVAEGFAPYPYEWWHWSLGDQRWAAENGVATSQFGPLEPRLH